MAVLAGHRLDEPSALQPLERPVEAARPDADAAEGLDVEHHRVAVLGTGGEAQVDEERGLRRVRADELHAVPLLRMATTRFVVPMTRTVKYRLHHRHRVRPSVLAVAVNVAVRRPFRGSPSEPPTARFTREKLVSRLGFEPRTRGSKVSPEDVHRIS